MLNYYKIVFRVIKESLQINIGPHNAPKTFSSVTSLLLHSITPLILVQINLGGGMVSDHILEVCKIEFGGNVVQCMYFWR